ncbi:MAG: tRNA (N6-isopentenyl adenosine(37)-C2)-methylthiotransferase MiaB [Clostridia bacterium]|jgi:tRNA-2-methylthio-N6-dimethylallyladenosine synthase
MEKQKDFIKKIKLLTGNKKYKYKINTFGCQMNENDSEKLAGILLECGFAEVSESDECDLVLFNTCCVRENAELKVYGHLGALKKLKSQKPEMIIVVSGCMMQQKEVVENIKKKYKHVDIVFGTHNLFKFPEMLYNSIISKEPVYDISTPADSIFENVPIERKDKTKAWVTIMYGCDNFCSYCIVPYVRGRERSRKIDDIVNEVKMLARDNVKEVTLLGQNVNSYGKEFGTDSNFAQLLKKLDEVDGLYRIRFMTSHPKDLSEELIYAIRDLKKVSKHIHLPIQSGSTRILKEMNRKYSKENYVDLIKKIRLEIADISITTDIIVGFPGETEDDFNETIELIREARFDSAYTFLYSKRSGTPAAELSNQVPESVAKERFQELVKVQNKISRELNNSLLGCELDVLAEGFSKNNPDMLTGRTDTNKIMNFKGDESLVGEIVKVKIEKIQTWSLEGRIVQNNDL